jgi:hypothetical protein
MANEKSGIKGKVTWELTGPNGEVKGSGVSYNLVTDYGDTLYAKNGAGISSPPAVPTGMKLGTQATPASPAKSGTNSTLQTYLTGSQHAFDATYPQFSQTGGAGAVITYKCTYAAGEADSASAITEAVIVNDTLTDSAPVAGETVSRVLLTGIGSKGASDTLTITWTHTLLGA